MRWSTPSQALAAVVMAVVWSVPAGAQSPAELEKAIRDALTRGREVEACQLALKMQPFKGQPEHAQAKQMLLQHGISLETPLESLSVKRMVALQNKLEAQRAKTQALPTMGPYPDYLDAWGTPIRVEMVSRRVFVYMLRAAGPDQKFMTDDDLAIATRDEAVGGAKLRDLRMGLSGAVDEISGEPKAEGGGPSGGGSGAPAGAKAAGGSGGDPGQEGSVVRSLPDPARSAGRRGLYGVSSPPPAGRSSAILEPMGGGSGARTRPKETGGGNPAPPPEREVTVEELLKR